MAGWQDDPVVGGPATQEAAPWDADPIVREPPPRADPSAGMSSGALRLAGVGRGMTNVAMNVGDIAGRIPGLGRLRPSPEAWQEFNRASGTLLGAQRPTGAQVPVTMLTGDPETDARIKASIEARYGTGRPGAEGSGLGEIAAVAPVAGAAGKLLAPVLGRVLPAALQVPAVAGAEGATAGAVLGGPGGRIEGAAKGGALGAGLGGILQAAGGTPRAAPPPPATRPTGLLASAAERAAVRATNADRTATRRALKGSETARQDLGRFILDEVPVRSPSAMREGAQRVQAQAGPDIGRIAAAADNTGATVDLGAAITAARESPAIANLNRNTVTRAAYRQITDMLDEQFQVHGGRIPPSVAHDLRIQLDSLGKWDRTAPEPVVAGWRAARKAVDAELDAAMSSAGLANQWNAASARFSQSRKLARPDQKGLADIGAERRIGNRLGSPSEKASAVLSGLGAVATANPALLLVPPATAALNRGFFPTAARSLDWASKLGQRAAAPVDPQIAALIAALAAAEEEGP